MSVSPSPSRFVPVLFLIFVFLLMVPIQPLAAPGDEVGGRPGAEGMSLDLSALGTDLVFKAGYDVFTEDDMYDTYGGLPSAGVDLSVGISPETRFVLGLMYGRCSGDPHYDRPDFEAEDDVRVQAVPVSFGFMINGSENPTFRLYWGFRVEMTWVEERVPDMDPDTNALYRDDRGWVKGMRLTLSPEWRSRDQARALGISLEWCGGSERIGSGRFDHTVSLARYGARLYYVMAL